MFSFPLGICTVVVLFHVYTFFSNFPNYCNWYATNYLIRVFSLFTNFDKVIVLEDIFDGWCHHRPTAPGLAPPREEANVFHRLHAPVALHVLGVAFERLIPQPLDSVGRVPDRESPAIRPECELHSEARHLRFRYCSKMIPERRYPRYQVQVQGAKGNSKSRLIVYLSPWCGGIYWIQRNVLVCCIFSIAPW